jgi:aspartyl-tRNA(Asn)/glutamyl-tRNA(Gln) amidotransferase subunit C
MSEITRDEVSHLAKLARINMSEGELDHLAAELAQILHAVDRVQEAVVGDILPTSHPLPLANVTRADLVVASLTPEQALSGAPAKAEERFKVPQILGDAE